MAIFQIFKKPQIRNFNIPYRFYDPDKEEREEREARIKRELGLDDKEESIDYKSAISGSFRNRLSPRFDAKKERTNSTFKVILFVFIMALAALLYFR